MAGRCAVLTHGGDWQSYADTFGVMPLDFSASISPLGVPEGVRRAVQTAAEDCDRYPDPLCRRLRQEIAHAEQVAPEEILCGNGAADLIFRAVLARHPQRALVTAPTFAEYEQALACVGCAVERYSLSERNGFALTEECFTAVTGMDMVFLCQPNNPTGRTVPKSLVKKIACRCQTEGALLVLDECFVDFLDTPEDFSLVSELNDHKNVLVLKAFTKLYGMAGVRLGYCLSADRTLLEQMRRCGQPWAVSSLAQAAGLAALEEQDYCRQVRELIREQRNELCEALTGLGLSVIPGAANFLLLYSETPLAEPLAERGILLRNCENYAGLSQGWYRIAIRTVGENKKLIDALREVLR